MQAQRTAEKMRCDLFKTTDTVVKDCTSQVCALMIHENLFEEENKTPIIKIYHVGEQTAHSKLTVQI